MARVLTTYFFILLTTASLGQIASDSTFKNIYQLVLTNSYNQEKKIIKKSIEYDIYFIKSDSNNLDSIIEDLYSGYISDLDSGQIVGGTYNNPIEVKIPIKNIHYIVRNKFGRYYLGGGLISFSIWTMIFAPIVSINSDGGPYHTDKLISGAATGLIIGAVGSAIFFPKNKSYYITERNSNKIDEKYWYIENQIVNK